MAFYNDRKKVLEFTYREVSVVIVNAMRGVRCCDRDQRPSTVLCPTCGKRLKHLPVTLVLVEAKVILELARVTPLHARRKAEALIDQLYSEIDSDRPPKDDEKDDGKGVPPEGVPPSTDPPSAKAPPGRVPPMPPGDPPDLPPGVRPPSNRRRPGDGDAEVPPLPPGFDVELVGGDGKNDAAAFAQLVEAVKKLGWGEQIRQILDDVQRRRPKN